MNDSRERRDGCGERAWRSGGGGGGDDDDGGGGCDIRARRGGGGGGGGDDDDRGGGCGCGDDDGGGGGRVTVPISSAILNGIRGGSGRGLRGAGGATEAAVVAEGVR